MGVQGRVSDSFPGVDESLTDRLTNIDPSTMSGAEMVAHLDAVEQHKRYLIRTALAMLDENAELVAQYPHLQDMLADLRSQPSDELEHLRAVTPEELSGPGS